VSDEYIKRSNIMAGGKEKDFKPFAGTNRQQGWGASSYNKKRHKSSNLKARWIPLSELDFTLGGGYDIKRLHRAIDQSGQVEVPLFIPESPNQKHMVTKSLNGQLLVAVPDHRGALGRLFQTKGDVYYD
jgi:hypothetical protein